MKRIYTGNIVGSTGMKFKSGTMNHIFNAIQDSIDALVKNKYMPTTAGAFPNVIVLWGCENTVSLPSVQLNAGAVYVNGEVFLVDAMIAPITPAGGYTVIFNIDASTVTGANADPVLFTNNTPYNIHLNRKGILSTTNTLFPAGFDYSAWVYPSGVSWTSPTFLNSWVQSTQWPSTCRYGKDINGMIRIEGGFHNATNPVGASILFQLPAGYRPLTKRTFLITAITSTAVSGVCICQVDTNGNVYFAGNIVSGSTAMSSGQMDIDLGLIEFDTH